MIDWNWNEKELKQERQLERNKTRAFVLDKNLIYYIFKSEFLSSSILLLRNKQNVEK